MESYPFRFDCCWVCFAFVGELIARKPVRAAAFGGLGAFLGFLSGECIKVVACVIMLVCYIRCL